MKIEEIEDLTLEGVKRKYNEHAVHTSEGLGFWQTIYNIKKQDELNTQLKSINEIMLKHTKWMTRLTLIMLFATLINVIIAFLMFIK
jgi:hypothetical protein